MVSRKSIYDDRMMDKRKVQRPKNQDPRYDDIRGGTIYTGQLCKMWIEASVVCTKSGKVEQTISRQEPETSAKTPGPWTDVIQG